MCETAVPGDFRSVLPIVSTVSPAGHLLVLRPTKCGQCQRNLLVLGELLSLFTEPAQDSSLLVRAIVQMLRSWLLSAAIQNTVE